MNLSQTSDVLKGAEPICTSTCDPATGAIDNAEQQDAGLEETRTATPADHAEQPCKGGIMIEMILTSLISPNNYNPNRLTTQMQQEYVAEVRRLGRLPQPL